MDHSYSRCVEEVDEEQRRNSSILVHSLPPLLSNVSASFDEGIVLLSADQNRVDVEEITNLMEDGEHLHQSTCHRRRKRTKCDSAAVMAGATMLLAFGASSSGRTSWRNMHNAPIQTTNADPCAGGTWSFEPRIDNGFYGDLGVMYSVAGSSAYAEEEFLPLIQYLRDALHIPDATIRARKRTERHLQFEQDNITDASPQKSRGASKSTAMGTRFALVTQPHLCRTILQPVLPFFDVITVVDLDNITSTIAQTTKKEHNIMIEDERRISSPTNQEKRKADDNEDRFLSIASQKMKPQQQKMVDLHRAKAVKVLALSKYAPFKQTIYLDLDMVPCQKNFARALLRSAGKSSVDARHFDIALPFASHPNVNLPMPSIDKQRHYYRQNSQGNDAFGENKEELGGRGINQHNSAAVILNMTSRSTRELLFRFESDFFSSSSSDFSRHLPTLDQPSLGRALYSIFLENTNASLRHVDLDPERVRRKGSRYERSKDQGLAEISCGKSNSCIVIHKPTQLNG